MSYADAWSAVNLEMPPRVPRTEYSAEYYHWELLARVTGLPVTAASPQAERAAATRAFMQAWDYGLRWATLIASDAFGKYRADLGHAAYASDASDQHDAAGSFFTSPEEVLNFDPREKLPTLNRAEITARFSRHYADNCAAYPDAVNMTGIYITALSGLIELFGWDLLLLAAGDDAEKFGEVMNRYAEWNLPHFLALADSAAPVVMIHDDFVWTSGAFLPPAWYREYLFPNLKKMLAPLRDAGKKILFTADGNYTDFIDDVANAGVHGFILEPTTDMAQIAERYGKTHVIVGNADTRILLTGSRADIRNEVARCLAIGKNCPGYFLAVGNHIPANTPVENALYYNECYMEMRGR
jgi:hypothetical protein